MLALQILHALLTHHIVVLLRYHLCRHFLILSLQAQINRIKLGSIADVNSVSARLEFHLCTPWLGTMHDGQTNLPIYVVLSGLDWVRVTSLDSGYLLSQNIILFDHATHAILFSVLLDDCATLIILFFLCHRHSMQHLPYQLAATKWCVTVSCVLQQCHTRTPATTAAFIHNNLEEHRRYR